MENLDKTSQQITIRIFLVNLALQLLTVSICLWIYSLDLVSDISLILIYLAVSLMTGWAVGWIAGRLARLPLQAIGNAIMHVSPSHNQPAPCADKLAIGGEYISSLAYHLYQIASLQDNKILAEHKHEATQASNILTHLPLPIFVFNSQQIVTFSSDSALEYCQLESYELFGQSLFEAVDLEFTSDFTLERWILDCQKNKATDKAYWRRVRVHLKKQDTYMQCDMAGYYNLDNPKGVEFIVTMFDRTQEYSQDDQSLSFIALAVHELRTPLTMMRGYLEVFEEELKGKLGSEMTEFMNRLHGATQQLSTFVNNVLNVARIEENQLSVKLAEQNWEQLLRSAGDDMGLRSRAFDRQITFDIAPNLPTVAADHMTIYEVICNLLDNSLKYSAKGSTITIGARLSKDGLIETTVQDTGIGIPTSVIPSLFEKFHRNHRNKAQISGTGLGLYLSKAIVNAHGGDIWVKSKEGEGTTVGFTLKPYSQLAAELENGNNKDAMIRTAHGWIKNHSLYRR